MEQLNEFMVNNYIWITIVCLFLIFTLIGYMADKSKNKDEGSKEQKKVKPTPIVKNEEVKEIVNNGEVTNNEENINPESVNNIEIPTQVEESKPVENEIEEPKFEEPIITTEEKEEINNIENEEEPVQKSLEELIAENELAETSNNDINVEQTEITEEQKKIEENVEETVNEEIPKDADVVNAWEPELTVENKEIVAENDDEKKDSI